MSPEMTKSTTSRELPAIRRVTITPNGSPRQYEVGGQSVTFVPLAIKRRKSSKVLVPPPGASHATIKSSFDLPMIRTLGKAFYWQRLLDSGEIGNATDLARRFKLEPGWVTAIRLAPLSLVQNRSATERARPDADIQA